MTNVTDIRDAALALRSENAKSVGTILDELQDAADLASSVVQRLRKEPTATGAENLASHLSGMARQAAKAAAKLSAGNVA